MHNRNEQYDILYQRRAQGDDKIYFKNSEGVTKDIRYFLLTSWIYHPRIVSYEAAESSGDPKT